MGVTLSSGGSLSGTPAAGTGGTYTINLSVSNGVGAAGTQTFTLTVNEAPAFTSANTATFTVGTNGPSFQVTALGFPVPTFGLAPTSVALPAGLSLSSGGVLSGTPNAGTGGTYTITIRATNSVTTTDQSFTLTVNETAAFTNTASKTFTAGVSGTTFQFTASGFPGTFAFTTASNLPDGLTLSSAGLLSGTPTTGTGGVYTLVMNVSNGVGVSTPQNFTLTINEQPAITSGSETTFVVGTAGSFQVAATGHPTSFTYSVTSGALPTGVALDLNTGALSGIPAVGTGGVYPFTLSVSNGVLTPATQKFTLTVNEEATFTSVATTTFTAGTDSKFQFSAKGQPASFTYALVSGSLPNGVSLTSAGALTRSEEHTSELQSH